MLPVVTQEDKQMRLSWRGVIGVMLGTAVLAFVFISLRRFDLARPAMVSIAMVGLAIVMRSELHKHVWFWIAMTLLAVLHLPLILFIPWTTKWIPAIFIAPIGIADLYAMLWVISVVRKSMGELTASPAKHP
jgi:uncharacterized membrane protein YjgN (DUF898 family)